MEISVQVVVFPRNQGFHVNRVLLVFHLFVSQYIYGLCLSVESINKDNYKMHLMYIHKEVSHLSL